MTARVERKSIDHHFKEQVNGHLFIPVLGNLFPSLWGDVRAIERKRYLIHTATAMIEVGVEEFDRIRIGDDLELNGRDIL